MYDSFTFRSKKADGAAGDPASTNSFATVEISAAHQGYQVDRLTVPTSGPLSVCWKNTGAASIDSRVLGSNDPTAAEADWDVVVAAAAIVAGAMRFATVNPSVYQFYRFQHKSTVADTPGASNIVGCLKGV